jgi:flagellar biosynthesis protein FlhG
MGWEQALRKWTAPRREFGAGSDVSAEGRPNLRVVRSASVCVASGKGGTGKTVLAASLAELLSTRGRTLIVDADMGVGNAHILQDKSPHYSFVDVVAGRCDVGAARVRCSPELDLIGGGSGVSQMSALGPRELRSIAHGLSEIEDEYDFVLVDSGAGISEQTVGFAAACDVVLVVTTPDLTAMTDAYAFIKVLHARRPELVPLLAVNRVVREDGPEHDGPHVAERIGRVCQKFLGLAPKPIGWVPDDRAVARSVAARRSVVAAAPDCEAATSLRALTDVILEELSGTPRRGLGRSLVRQVGPAS